MQTDYTRTQGLLNFVFGITALVGPLLVGILFDTTGSYLTGFLSLAALGLLGGIVLIIVYHILSKERPAGRKISTEKLLGH